MKNVLSLILSLLAAGLTYAQPCDFPVDWEITPADCPELTIEITPQGGQGPFTIEYIPGGIITTIGQTGETANIFLPESVDTIIVIDDLGASCYYAVLPWNGPIQPGIWGIVQPNCPESGDGQISNIATGGHGDFITIDWTGPNGLSGQGTSLQNLNQGLYNLTFSDFYGCTHVDSWDLEASNSPDFELISNIAQPACANSLGHISIDVMGGCGAYDYSWSNGMTSPSLSNLAPGIYGLTVTDCNGCSIAENFIIQEDPPLLVVDIVTSPGCLDEINVFGGCPPYMYELDGAPLLGLPTCGLGDGDYAVIVTDACGCQNIQPVTIGGNDIVLTGEITLPTCESESDGAIDLTVIGGEAGYAFEWSTGISTEDQTGLTEGIYSVTVTDANNNSQTAVFDLNIPFIMMDYEMTCESAAGVDGSISITMIDHGSPYTYEWSNGSTDQNQSGMNSGIYYLTVTNVYGCQSVFSPFFVCHDSMGLNMDTMLCAGSELLLDGQFDEDIDFISWTDVNGNEIDCDTCSVTTIYPHTSGTIGAVYNSPTLGAIYYSFEVDVIEGCVWPGDTDSSTVVDQFDLFPICLLYDEIGPPRVDQDIEWSGHPADDFGIQVPGVGVDAKHVDCNGNGTINLQDTAAIILNWGEMHKSGGDEEDGLGVPIYVGTDTIYDSEATISLPIYLGNTDSIAEDVYAIGFSIYFDPVIMVEGSAGIEVVDSWFAENSPNMGLVSKEFLGQGRLDLAIGRTNNEGVTGLGQIANFIITMEDDIMKPSFQSFDISIKDVRLIGPGGDDIDVFGKTTTSYYLDSTSVHVTDLSDEDPSLVLFPNPAQLGKELYIISNRDYQEFELFNSSGSLVKQGSLHKGKIGLSSNLSPGLYAIRLKGDEGSVSRKLIVQ